MGRRGITDPAIERLAEPLIAHLGTRARWRDHQGVIARLRTGEAALRVRLACALCAQRARTVYLVPDARGRYGRAYELAGGYLSDLRRNVYVCQYCKDRVKRPARGREELDTAC